METTDPHILGVLAITAGVSFAMTWLAARMSMIEFHRPARRPSCGRQQRAGVCGCPD